MNLILQTTIFMKWKYYSKLKKFVHSGNHSLILLFQAKLSLIRGDFEPTIVWSGVPCYRTIVWTMIWFWFGPWSHNCWTMVWFWCDQRSSPWGKVWSETVSSALRAHRLFWAHFTVIGGYFGLGWSDQRSLRDDTSTWDPLTFRPGRLYSAKSKPVVVFFCDQLCQDWHQSRPTLWSTLSR